MSQYQVPSRPFAGKQAADRQPRYHAQLNSRRSHYYLRRCPWRKFKCGAFMAYEEHKGDESEYCRFAQTPVDGKSISRQQIAANDPWSAQAGNEQEEYKKDYHPPK
jgi:hypothetical protein